MTNKKQAQALWADLRSALTRADQAIAEIIATRAWEPLGYSSFAEAWASEMQGVRLAAEIRAHVVYAMHDSGLDLAGIDSALGIGSGVGHSSIEKLLEDKALGIPPERASVVRRHIRRKPEARRVLHVDLGEDLLVHYQAIARKRDVRLEDVVRIALIDWAR